LIDVESEKTVCQTVKMQSGTRIPGFHRPDTMPDSHVDLFYAASNVFLDALRLSFKCAKAVLEKISTQRHCCGSVTPSRKFSFREPTTTSSTSLLAHVSEPGSRIINQSR
jgi:hypothetical protein